MGTLDKIAKILNMDKPAHGVPRSQFVNFGAPLFSTQSRDIFASDIVKTAIHRIAEAVSKCVLRSVIVQDNPRSVTNANNEFNSLFRARVNPYMTTKDFLYKIAFLTIANENCFIYPHFDEVPVGVENFVRRIYRGFYPLENITKGVIYYNDTELRIELSNNKGVSFDMPYEDIIHIRHKYGQHPFIGGDSEGNFNARALVKNLQVLDGVKEAIPKALEAAFSIKGVLTMKGLPEFDQKNIARDDFEKHITSSKYGLLATDYGTDFHPVNISAVDIPENTMNFIRQEILFPFGVSMPIMEGKYTDQEYSAFYQTTIEGLLTAISQAFTATVFTGNQLTRGHRIRAYDRLVQNLSMERRMEIVRMVKDSALLEADEQRELLGYEPNGQPTRVSLNYVTAEIANSGGKPA